MKTINAPKISLYIVLFSIVSLLTLNYAAAQSPPSKLVSSKWLAENINQQNMRIVDVRSSIRDYWQSHIPGAVYFHPESLRLSDHGVPGKLLPPEILTLALGKMGIDNDTLVIVYSENNDFKAPYLIWALDYIAHHKAAMLDGGFDKWQKDKYPTNQDYPSITPASYPRPPHVREEVRASLDEVKKAVASGRPIIIDVRPVELYNGEKGFWKRLGHIKDAISHPWADDLDQNGSWKTKNELLKTYLDLGAKTDETVIVSCGQGQMSSHTYFTLKYILGFSSVQNYDGSFNEWSNIDNLPVETKSAKTSND